MCKWACIHLHIKICYFTHENEILEITYGTRKNYDSISLLQRHFDCKISPLVFPPVYLAWMIAMWSGALANTSKYNFYFIFPYLFSLFFQCFK